MNGSFEALATTFAILVILVALAVWSWRGRRETRKGVPVAVMMAAQALWVAGWIGEVLADDLSAKMKWDGATWIIMVIAMSAPVWIAQVRRAKRPAWLAFAALLVATGPVAVYSMVQSFAGRRTSAYVLPGEPFGSLYYDLTWAETGIALFLTMAIAWSAGMVMFEGWRRGYSVRTSAIILSIGIAGPYLMSNIGIVVGMTWMGQRDVAPVAFALFAPFTMLAVMRARNSQLLMVAREQVVERLADPVIVLDGDTRILDFNGAAASLLAISPRSVGMSLSELPAASQLHETLQEEPTDTKLVMIGNRSFDVRVTTVSGDGGACAVVLHDVTALEAANAALRTSHELLERRVEERTGEVLERERMLGAIFDNSVQYMGLLDAEGRIVSGNPASLGLLRLKASDVMGTPFWETPWWAHDEKQRQELREGFTLASAGHPFRMLATHPDAAGNLRDVDFTLTPIRDESGVVHHFVAEGVDLTEMRRGEREREALQQQVMHLQRLESVGRLAGGVAHDFNNYLTAIIGNVALLREELGNQPEHAEVLDEVLHAARGAATVTRQLLAIGRRQSAGVGPVDVFMALDRLRGLFARILGESIVIEIDVAAGTGQAAIDPGPLEQVLVNLAINARDAMLTGGTLRIGASKVQLPRSEAMALSLAPGNYVRIDVADTGHGMDQQVLARVFEPFFTTKPEGVGTGLGLAIVFNVIRSAGGHVEVTSTVDVGTQFRMFLPSAAGQLAASAAETERAPQRGEGTILVVDDREEVRRLAVRALTERGFEVDVASDGHEAIALLDTGRRPDVLLCDVRMPGMSGPELVRAIRARGVLVPTLYMSGQHDIELELEEGDALIEKPFTIDALVAAVRRSVKHAQAATRVRAHSV